MREICFGELLVPLWSAGIVKAITIVFFCE